MKYKRGGLTPNAQKQIKLLLLFLPIYIVELLRLQQLHGLHELNLLQLKYEKLSTALLQQHLSLHAGLSTAGQRWSKD